MFHFGLFSTFIPYLIVGILYLIGMSHYGKNLLFPKENDSKNEIIHSQTISDKHTSASCFFKEKYNHTDIYINKRAHFIDTQEDTIIRYTHIYFLKESNYYSYYFSRPPPQLS